METKHTPGPWTVRDHGGYIEVETPDEPPVAHFGDLSINGPDHNWALANARLIAAAPDMAAALAAIISRAEWNGHRSGWDLRCDLPAGTINLARAAIAKAEGR